MRQPVSRIRTENIKMTATALFDEGATPSWAYKVAEEEEDEREAYLAARLIEKHCYVPARKLFVEDRELFIDLVELGAIRPRRLTKEEAKYYAHTSRVDGGLYEWCGKGE